MISKMLFIKINKTTISVAQYSYGILFAVNAYSFFPFYSQIFNIKLSCDAPKIAITAGGNIKKPVHTILLL